MRVLKILMISPQFSPLVGGYERAAERLSKTLTARGHLVEVAAERRDRRWARREVREGVRIERLWCLYRPRLHMVTALLSFAWFLLRRGRRFDVWHIHQYGAHAVLAVALSKVLRRPVLLKLICDGPEGLEKVVSELPWAAWARSLLRRTDAVAAVSRETKDEALAFGFPPERVFILGNGVDTQSFRPRSGEERVQFRSKLGVAAAGLVLFVGRLAPQKNVKGLLAGWSRATQDLPAGWKLAIVGDGALKEQLISISEAKHLSTAVSFIGAQSNIDEWMAAADIYVLSSHFEGLSNTTLEAMASGLPVVSTRVSGSAETLRETGAGIVTDVGREDLLAEALVRLAHDEALRKTMGMAARKAVETKYSIDRVASRYEQVYRSLLKGGDAKVLLECAE